MIGFLRRNSRKIPIIGDMLCSLLVFPFAFNFLEEWSKAIDIASVNRRSGVLSFSGGTGGNRWLCALYLVMALAHLFRAFRRREKSRTAFIAQLIYGFAYAVCAALPRFMGYTDEMCKVLVLIVLAAMLAGRVLAIVRRHTVWSIIVNAIAILMIVELTQVAGQPYAIMLAGLVASFSALASILAVAFSQIRYDVLRDIVRKTYAIEIICGLLLTMVAFSYMLEFIDDAFTSFWDALWYCFAVVTTIGFGDLSPVTATGRLITIILGVYGIIVVALITSVIVNFYGEMKRTDTVRHDGVEGMEEEKQEAGDPAQTKGDSPTGSIDMR